MAGSDLRKSRDDWRDLYLDLRTRWNRYVGEFNAMIGAKRERFKTTIDKINDLAGERNAAVHTMWAIDWQYWGGPALYFPKIGVAPGAIPHKKLKDDFSAQCAELNRKLQEHFVELDRIRSEYEKLTA
jgi:hypothetical protein